MRRRSAAARLRARVGARLPRVRALARRVRAAVRRRGAPSPRATQAAAPQPVAQEATERPARERAALDAYRRGAWGLVVEELEALLEEEGRVPPRIHVRLAVAHRRTGELDRARAAVQEGLRRFPDHPRLVHELAEVEADAGDHEAAVAQWRRAIRLVGDDTPATLHAGESRALRRLGRLEEAQEAAQVGVDRHPGDARVHRELAETASARGALEEAVERWRELLAHHGEEAAPRHVYVRLAAALRGMRRLDDAAEVVARGLEHLPGDAALCREMAEIHMRALDWDLAASWWERAVLARGDSDVPPRWRFSQGMSLERAQRLAEAEEAYAHALAGLAQVDESWANEAALAWRFRHAYVRRRLAGNEADDARLDCVVLLEEHGRAPDPSPGWCQALVTYKGINISGVLEERVADTVEVFVNDRHLKSVAVDPVGPAAFALHLKHPTLATFPALARVTVTAGGQRLAAEGTAAALRLAIPHGDATLYRRLEDGEVLTKKGTLVDPAAVQGAGGRRLVAAYARLAEHFDQRLQRPLFLLYGTLLGVHRDGAFIRGDDDLDVGYLSAATTPQEAKQEATEVALAVLRAGFDVTTRFGGSLLKVLVDDVEIDIYPVWFFRGRAWAYDAIEAGPEWYEPSRPVGFHGFEVRVPAEPERLLEATYGPRWQVPDPAFRHTRSAEVLAVLRETALRPSEARRLNEINEQERSRDGSVGVFVVTQDPAARWLRASTPEGRRSPTDVR